MKLLFRLPRLKAVFDKISITTSAVRPEFDKNTNSTVLKSEIKTDMTPAVFKELAAVVAEIRTSFVK
ncbi:MAG: hypothetical protein IPN67_11730 [Bacteroidales bacterium]|nr:hypothetical protein [Bacteroidales bacterium]